MSFVAHTVFLEASVWIASDCFFKPEEQLSLIELLYILEQGAHE